MRTLSICFLLFTSILACRVVANEAEFTVLVYNLENCFDLDGVALYEDYMQESENLHEGYSRRKLLTKLQTAAKVLASLNRGEGPEIVIFQELEADFTPQTGGGDPREFLRKNADIQLEAMLTDEWESGFAGIPAVTWMLKALHDAGLKGYEVVAAPAQVAEAGLAHINAVFSKFPVRSVRSYALDRARDILEVEIDVKGHTVVVYNNHWKSGASNPQREPIRVKNAGVLRQLIDARLAADPQVDIIIGGDLNSHYNHDLLFPDIDTGINGVLGSQGDESFGGGDIYNLWYELPVAERYSDVWRGKRGTLMHLLLTRGLYDAKGISYIDGSFNKLVLPGLNADALRRPLRWTFAGNDGGGASDHFPVYARFTTGPFRKQGDFSPGDDAPQHALPLAYRSGMKMDLPSGVFLNDIPDARLGEFVGRLYAVGATLSSQYPQRVEVNGTVWPAYTPDPALRKRLKPGRNYDLVVSPTVWKGEPQLLIEGIR